MRLLTLILASFLPLAAFGAQQTINVGTTANDGTGDTLRTAFGKANSNFTELYTADTAARSVATGGTGQTTYTNGQILIGNTSGNTLTKGTLTGTTAEITITNGAGTITFSLPTALTFTGKTVTGGTFAGITGTGTWDLSAATVSLGTMSTTSLTATTLVLGATTITATGTELNSLAGLSGTIATSTNTISLANKRVTPRITSITSSATPTVNTDNCDCVTITALAAAVTSMTTNLTGTPANFDQLEYRIKDNGTARAISWGASFASGTGTLPITTVLSKALHAWFEWDSVQSKWICLSVGSEP